MSRFVCEFGLFRFNAQIKGHAEAANNLGAMFEYGYGVPIGKRLFSRAFLHFTPRQIAPRRLPNTGLPAHDGAACFT